MTAIKSNWNGFRCVLVNHWREWPHTVLLATAVAVLTIHVAILTASSLTPKLNTGVMPASIAQGLGVAVQLIVLSEKNS